MEKSDVSIVLTILAKLNNPAALLFFFEVFEKIVYNIKQEAFELNGELNVFEALYQFEEN